jgi:hypothetical protein
VVVGWRVGPALLTLALAAQTLPCPVTAAPRTAAEATVWYSHQAADGTMPYRVHVRAPVPGGGLLDISAEGHPVAVEWVLHEPGSGTRRVTCGVVPDPIFTDNFDSGGPAAWSAVRP